MSLGMPEAKEFPWEGLSPEHQWYWLSPVDEQQVAPSHCPYFLTTDISEDRVLKFSLLVIHY